MIGVAAEVADGVRLHPVCSARYIKDVVKPTISAKRISTKPFDVCLKPLVAAGANDEELSARREVARQRLAFYVSTPAYRGAFDQFGLTDLASELAELSNAQRWTNMAERIDDTTLDEWVLSATYDNLADAVRERYAGLIDRIELSIPVTNDEERESLKSIVLAVQSLE